MNKVISAIEKSQELFRDRMLWVSKNGGLTEDVYARLLTVEYHLTNGVQRHFLMAASHPDLSKRKSLRKFLFDFANEEELHYQIAKTDLKNMGREPGPCPMDVSLWRAYFDSVILERPFLRLGGTCILENITAKSRDVLGPMIKSAQFLNEKNTRFIILHQHSADVPHGDQIVEALTQAKLDDQQMEDLLEGTRISSILFLRLMDWCISGDELKDIEDKYKVKS